MLQMFIDWGLISGGEYCFQQETCFQDVNLADLNSDSGSANQMFSVKDCKLSISEHLLILSPWTVVTTLGIQV